MAVSESEFLRWEVKPIWKVSYPSSLVKTSDGEFELYGVDRGSMDISRNWEKIHSVEQFNQGFIAKPTDFTFTIAMKERGQAFEKFRRLSKAGVLFDVECNLLKKSGLVSGDRPEENSVIENFEPWLDGMEVYRGCIVAREGQTIELAEFPVREFECEFLRHVILESLGDLYNTEKELSEGDGVYPHLDDLNL